MNMIKAFEETLALAREHGLENVGSDTPDADYNHLVDMLEQIKKEPEKFSEGKLGRWLGWAQCAVYMGANGDIPLDELKEINKRNK